MDISLVGSYSSFPVDDFANPTLILVCVFLGNDSFARNEIETQLKFIKMWGVRRKSETVWLMRATAINYCSYCSAKPARSVICQETLSTCNVLLARSSDTLWFVFVFLQTHAMIRLIFEVSKCCLITKFWVFCNCQVWLPLIPFISCPALKCSVRWLELTPSEHSETSWPNQICVEICNITRKNSTNYATSRERPSQKKVLFKWILGDDFIFCILPFVFSI